MGEVVLSIYDMEEERVLSEMFYCLSSFYNFLRAHVIAVPGDHRIIYIDISGNR